MKPNITGAAHFCYVIIIVVVIHFCYKGVVCFNVFFKLQIQRKKTPLTNSFIKTVSNTTSLHSYGI